jgi:hypothetical protein
LGFYTFTPLKILTENLNISVEILSLFDGKIWYLKALTELKYEVYRNVSCDHRSERPLKSVFNFPTTLT